MLQNNKCGFQINYNNSFNYTDLSRSADHRLFTAEQSMSPFTYWVDKQILFDFVFSGTVPFKI